jgi:hypothetical protein
MVMGGRSGHPGPAANGGTSRLGLFIEAVFHKVFEVARIERVPHQLLHIRGLMDEARRQAIFRMGRE